MGWAGSDWLKLLHETGNRLADWKTLIPYDQVGYHPYDEPVRRQRQANRY